MAVQALAKSQQFDFYTFDLQYSSNYCVILSAIFSHQLFFKDARL